MATKFEVDITLINNRLADLNKSIMKTRELISGGGESVQMFTKLNADIAARNALLEIQKRLLSDINTLQQKSAKPVGDKGGYTGFSGGKGTGEPQDPIAKILNEAGKQVASDVKKETAASARAAKAAEQRAKAEEQLALARQKVANDPRYRQALEQANKLGLGAENLKKIETRGGGVEQLLFQGKEGGVDKNFRTYVDKTGRSTPGLSSQFRSFGSDILRDIGQFTKWSIAVAAVYTPLQKLGELMQSMVDIESRLADATIAANIPFERSGEIFETVYVAANKAGEGIAGVIDAYSQAYRASGRYADEQERTQKTTALLNSSLTLSKLSTLDQAGAIDTLTAALLQSDLELDEGEKLLNKWVRVSQVANVDITTLATGVAVLGDSAEAAGLDVDHLNGLVAVLAEQSISGSKEAANTAKALIGAYQGDKAEQVLTKYGFALRKANGEVRDFLDVYRDLSKAREEGVLSEANVSEIATALGGGGSRRAKDVAQLINSQSRLNQIAKESALISDDSTLAQDSLSKKLETVETATTRLSNAFQGLAQTLGDDGGLLDAFKDILDILTFVIKGMDDLFELMGRSGPVLAATITSLIALKSISSSRQQGLLASLGGTSIGGAPITSTYGRGIGGFGKGILGDILQMNARGGAILGGAAIGTSAISNLRQGEGDRAAGNVIGGIIGAAIGATLGGPVGLSVGATIGSSIGDSFVSKVIEFKPEWESLFAPEIPKKLGEEGATEKTEKELLTEELAKSAGLFGTMSAQIQASILKNAPDFLTKNMPNAGFNKENITPGQILLYYAPDDIKRRIEQIENREKARRGETGIEQTPQFQQLRDDLQQKAVGERQRQLERLSAGEITSNEFGRITQQLSGFPSTAIRGVQAFGDEFIKASSEVDNLSQAYDEFLYISTYGTAEQIDQIAKYTTDIEYLKSIIESFDETDIGKTLELSFGDIAIKSKDQLEKLMQGLQLEAGTATSTLAAQIRLQQLNLPGIVGSTTEATPQADVELIRQEAEKLQQQFYRDMNLGDDAIKYLVENLEDFAVLVEKAGENHFDTITGIDQKFWDAAAKMLEDQGKLKADKGIGFQQFDVDRPTLERLAQQSLSMGSLWKEKFNYDFKPEDQVAISQEGIVKPLHADFKILALLLEKIVDQNQKQLDGQYNIPEGATFWVPLTAAYYRNKQDQGLGDVTKYLSEMETGELDTAGTELQSAAQQLKEAANRIMGTGDKADISRAGSYREAKVSGVDVKKKLVLDSAEAEGGIGGSAGGEIASSLATALSSAGLASILEKLTGFGVGGNSLGQSLSNQNAPLQPQQQTKLDLKMESTTNLVVDGRVLATIMKPFFAADLIKAETTQGTIAKRYII